MTATTWGEGVAVSDGHVGGGEVAVVFVVASAMLGRADSAAAGGSPVDPFADADSDISTHCAKCIPIEIG